MKKFLKKPVLIVLGTFILLVAISTLRSGKSDDPEALYHTVKKGDLTISIVEGGSLEAVNEVVIKNTIEGESRLIMLIPEGSYVKKDDLVAEFDSGKAESALQEQQVKFETSQASLVEAENDLIITRSTVESEVSTAQLAVDFARMDRQKFLDLERDHKIQDAQLKIDTEEESLKLAQQRYEWSKKLAEKGFETKSQVDRDKLEVSKSSKAVENAKSTDAMLRKFDLEKEEAKRDSDLKEAEAKLTREKKEGESKIMQKEALLKKAQSSLRLTEEILNKKKEQLKATKLYAPQDGLVIYAKPKRYWSDEPSIEEGAIVYNRREVIKIPDISKMRVDIKIHESMIGQVQKGLKTYIVLDSRPDDRYLGEVTKVAILPDNDRYRGDPNLKVYATEVTIKDQIEGIKPGVSARTEIIIKELKDVLTIPIQAVTTFEGEQVCYLEGNNEPTIVEVGLFNTKHIEIKSGLKPGDKVSLNPPLHASINLTGEISDGNSSENNPR